MDTPDYVVKATARVAAALKAVQDANAAYIEACKYLAECKMDAARYNPHEWLGMSVYRVMKGDKVRHRAEHGVVCFKEYDTPDYGNSHILPGSYYVLIDGDRAAWLDDSWMLDLL